MLAIKIEYNYKYKIGQFGHIYNTHTLKQSFVVITETLDLKKYKYQLCDIRSPYPKMIEDNELSDNQCASGWITESLFSPIDGTIESTNNSTDDLIQLVNWKICREHYLVNRINKMRLVVDKFKQIHQSDEINQSSRADVCDSKSENTLSHYSLTDSDNDQDESSYLPETDESSYCALTDSDNDNDILYLPEKENS
eukprot:419752_1